MKKWLDKYENGGGVESTMDGLTDKGFNYNGAWGGTMQMGGNLPGAAGMMYVRHGAPSNGKYAKKTKASAEEGIDILPEPTDPERKYKLSSVVLSAKELLNPLLRQKDVKSYDEWEKNRIGALKQGVTAHKEYLEKNPLKQYLSPEEVKTALSKEREGLYEDYIGALKGLREYEAIQPLQKASLAGNVEGEKEVENLNYGWRFATQPVNIAKVVHNYPDESFTYSYDRKTGEYKKSPYYRNGGKMMSYYQAGLDFEPKSISENGVEIAQNGIPNSLLRKQAFRESTDNPEAISPMGAIGLTQIMPSTYQDYLKATKNKPGKLTDPEESVRVQKWVMDNLYNAGFINKPNQSEEVRKAKVFAAYNYGRGNMSKLLDKAKSEGIDIYNSLDWTKKLPKETSTYLDQILFNKDADFEKKYQEALKTSPYTKLYEEPSEKPKQFKSNVPTIFDLGKGVVKPKPYKKGGKVKVDNDGYWNPENWGKPVEIESNEITMEGVYEPLLGISNTGDTQMMYPGEDYTFEGESVTEYPVTKNGGWLDKYK